MKGSDIINLDCDINHFLDNGIPLEYAKILLSDLLQYSGSPFHFTVNTKNVAYPDFNCVEEGNINIKMIKSIFEKEKQVEFGAICLSFLFFSNVLRTQGWYQTRRRGGHWDYWCLNSSGEKILIEIGGSTSKYGAKTDQRKKIDRLLKGKSVDSVYISSVGFQEANHIVTKT